MSNVEHITCETCLEKLAEVDAARQAFRNGTGTMETWVKASNAMIAHQTTDHIFHMATAQEVRR